MSEIDAKIKAVIESQNKIAKFFEELGVVFKTVSNWSNEDIQMLQTQTRMIEAREIILLIYHKLEELMRG